MNLQIAGFVWPEMVEDYGSGWTDGLDSLTAMVGELN